jgi:hypothetical protein
MPQVRSAYTLNRHGSPAHFHRNLLGRSRLAVSPRSYRFASQRGVSLKIRHWLFATPITNLNGKSSSAFRSGNTSGNQSLYSPLLICEANQRSRETGVK